MAKIDRKWKAVLDSDPLPWLMESDPENPGVRYFALRELLDRGEDDPEVVAARAAIMKSGPVPTILESQSPEGFWVKAGGGYSPKYQATTWQILLLAELGADPADERVRRGCEYLLEHSIASNGGFAASLKPVPSSAIHCLNGNMVYALLTHGYGDDPRVKAAIEWIARAITGEGFDYLRSGTTGPNFSCSANDAQPCAWGGNKAMRALLAIPEDERSPLVEGALELGAAFLLSRDPAVADYPYTGRVSSTWFKLGFPMSYWSDVLETASILAEMGYGKDPRLARATEWILEQQAEDGRWVVRNTLRNMWTPIEKKGKPSKWVTLRALRFFKRAAV